MDKTMLIIPENGLQYDWKAIAANPSAKHEPKMDLVAYKALYINKIAQARACGQEPVLVSLPIMDENRYFAHITHGMTMQERKNVLYWLGGKTERLRNIHAQYNLLLFRLASLQCVHIIDVTSPMLACTRFDELLEADGITLSAEGQALVNQEMTKVQSQAAA
ncbi:MAG: hypothetical protein J5761_02970 [Paludibacteraceae bacterium]|nr:hypothetical protein [Paludibacteraceae bacterium]